MEYLELKRVCEAHGMECTKKNVSLKVFHRITGWYFPFPSACCDE